jgi:tetratricopeptide (TPR) repeat protein
MRKPQSLILCAFICWVLSSAQAQQTAAQPTGQVKASFEAVISAADSLEKAGRLDDALLLFEQTASAAQASSQRALAEASWSRLLSRKIEAEGYRSSGLRELGNGNLEMAGDLFRRASEVYPDGAVAKSYHDFLLARTQALVNEGRFTEAGQTLAALRGLDHRTKEIGDLATAIEKTRDPLPVRIATQTALFLRSSTFWTLVGALAFAWAFVWLLVRRRRSGRRYMLVHAVAAGSKPTKPSLVETAKDPASAFAIEIVVGRLLAEVQRIQVVHQKTPADALDWSVEVLGQETLISPPQVEDDIAGRVEALEPFKIGGINLPFGQLFAMMLRWLPPARPITVSMEDASQDGGGILRLLATFPSGSVLVAEQRYEFVGDPKAVPDQGVLSRLASLAHIGGAETKPAPSSSITPLLNRSEALDSAIATLGSAIVHRLLEKSPFCASGSPSVFRVFTEGLLLQQEASAMPATNEMRAKRLEEALRKYEAVLRMQSDHAVAHFCKAGVELMLHREAESRKSYLRTLSLGNALVRAGACHNLAIDYYSEFSCSSYRAALEYCERGLQELKHTRDPLVRSQRSQLRSALLLHQATVAFDSAIFCSSSRKAKLALRRKVQRSLREVEPSGLTRLQRARWLLLNAHLQLRAGHTNYRKARAHAKAAFLESPESPEVHQMLAAISFYQANDARIRHWDKLRNQLVSLLLQYQHYKRSTHGRVVPWLQAKFDHFTAAVLVRAAAPDSAAVWREAAIGEFDLARDLQGDDRMYRYIAMNRAIIRWQQGISDDDEFDKALSASVKEMPYSTFAAANYATFLFIGKVHNSPPFDGKSIVQLLQHPAMLDQDLAAVFKRADELLARALKDGDLVGAKLTWLLGLTLRGKTKEAFACFEKLQREIPQTIMEERRGEASRINLYPELICALDEYTATQATASRDPDK